VLIHAFLYRSETPLDLNRLYGSNAVSTPTAGFVLEMGDQTQYPTFADFRAHLKAAKLASRWSAEKKQVELSYASGGNLLELGYDPARYPTPFRRVNGQWPYLPAGIQRDTPWSVQGRTGRLEKNGAVLAFEPGRTGYLQAVPETDTYIGYNPLPDPTCWSFTAPGGVRLQADGRLGVARVVVRPKARAIWIDTARKSGQNTPDMATALLVFGLRRQPVVVLNGRTLPKLATTKIDGETAYVIPLGEQVPEGVSERYLKYRDIPTLSRQTQFHDWHVAGPFPRDFNAVHPPETHVDLKAAYSGIDGVPVTWKRILAPGQPALGAGPVDLESVFSPAKNMLAYAYARVSSEQAQTVTMFTGSDQDIAVWINGQKVMRQQSPRMFYQDQDRIQVQLQKGENAVLLKLAHDWEGWKFNFRLADLDALAPPAGVRYMSPAEEAPAG
jgi:hypothetical protein